MKRTSKLPTKHSLSRFLVPVLLAGLLLCASGCLRRAEPKDKALVRRRLLDGVRASMVQVRLYFKRDIANEFGSGEQQVSYQERVARRMVDRKMSLDLGGVVLDRQGHILIADPETQLRLIDRIEVIAADGRIRLAKLVTIIKKMDAAVLEVSDTEGLQPVVFTPAEELDKLAAAKTATQESPPSLALISISRSGRDWRIRSSRLAGSYRYDSAEHVPEYFLGSTSGPGAAELSGGEAAGVSPSLIADKDGNFIGVTMRGILDLKEKHRIWKGKDILEAITGDLNVDDFRKSRQELQKEYTQLYHEVKIYYRQPKDEDYGPGTLPERIVYGLAIDPTTLLVPLEMSRREAKQIESIEVQLNGTDKLSDGSVSEQPEDSSSGVLLGAYRDFAAFVVRIEDGRFEKWLDLDQPGDIAKVVPIQTVHARRRFGGKDVSVWYARFPREAKDYGDRVHLQSSLPIFGGSLLLDLDGRLAGFYLRQRLPVEEQTIMTRVGPEYYSLGRVGYVLPGSAMMRIFKIGEIRQALRRPADAFDPNIRSMTKEQAKRRMWLGVEYVPLNKELAKSVDLESITKDGSVGFIVNVVYQGSPAAQMGIKRGDVLLRIKDTEASGEYPTELRGALGGGSRGRYRSKDWSSRKNFLTELLAAIGQDRSIEVTFCSRRGPEGWKLFTEALKIQQAPLDYDSAERHRDRSIGLTVRNLTYEVRHGLKMLPDAPGVVVSKIEEGTPAAVAKIAQGELITRIDADEVTSVDDFESKIVAAREAERDTVKVEILKLGETRLADLSLSK